MTSVKVHRDGYNWLAECTHHDDATWCGDWTSAMEAAWGHVAMWHQGRPATNRTNPNQLSE